MDAMQKQAWHLTSMESHLARLTPAPYHLCAEMEFAMATNYAQHAHLTAEPALRNQAAEAAEARTAHQAGYAETGLLA